MDYKELCIHASELVEQNNAQEAFGVFRPVLRYPGMVDQRDAFIEALQTFARISLALAGKDFTTFVQNAQKSPDDPHALYQLGYNLIEQELDDLAATVLVRAHQLAPDIAGILNELVVALDGIERFDEACRFLRSAPALLEEHLLCRYLLAFNAAMMGDLTTPRELLPGLQNGEGPHDKELADRIAAILKRAEILAPVCPLDSQDLRGWHFVLTAGLLLHLSPYGFDEGMHGRYAFIQDSPALCLEGIKRVQVALDRLQIKPSRVFALPERNSAILAHAIARALDCPVVEWPEAGSDEAGLIVAYDLKMVENSVLATLRTHRPGQVLWSHATCWVQDFPLAADITTFLYQYNTAPWDEHMRFRAETREASTVPADQRDVEILADEILQAELEAEALNDVPVLQNLVQALPPYNTSGIVGVYSATGQRERQWAGSPVLSSHFG